MFNPRYSVRLALPVAAIIVAVLRITPAASAQCGDSEAGDCCIANNTPHCDDQACCDAICQIDPFCCDAPWDEICAEQAEEFCGVCGAACGAPDAGACCEANPTPGCEDTACCATVCQISSFCCVGEWSDGCAEIAASWCLELCCPEYLDGNGLVGPFDLAMLLFAWGPNPGDPADFDDDGIVGPLDLATLLFAWGSCW